MKPLVTAAKMEEERKALTHQIHSLDVHRRMGQEGLAVQALALRGLWYIMAVALSPAGRVVHYLNKAPHQLRPQETLRQQKDTSLR